MSIRFKPSSVDERLHQAFGTPVVELYESADSSDASPSLVRVLEMRSFLALAEEQVARVLDHVRTMAPTLGMGELPADELRLEAQWLEAALGARDSYRTALDNLLRTMPPGRQPRTRMAPTTLSPPAAAPAPNRSGTVRDHRP
ncbi:hypothetical protein [Streptomyces sp. NPDC059604]|uniref:hypothetical protein n=1 Tax=Streptomyces sp. NPDC059604 TaxID=3346881 RepID=UPI0036831C55